MRTDKIKNITVKEAIYALQMANKQAWFSLFTEEAELYDDGNKMNFKRFFDAAIGHEHFNTIDMVKNNGLAVYGSFHSDKWGYFKTYFKFHINTDGKFNRLDIGQANY